MRSTAPKPFVFVLMPFDPSFNDVYRLGIQAACKAAGAYCERVDEQVYDGSILSRIYNQISKADIIVADMTGKNPNVFYETGYAHALGRKTILLTKNAEDIPFDLKHYVHIVYQGKISDLKDQLKRRIKYYVAHPEKKTHDEQPKVEYHVQSTNIERTPHVQLEVPDLTNEGPWMQNIDFDIHNCGDISLDLSQKQFAIVFPSEMAEACHGESNAIRLPDSKIMILRRGSIRILYPESWYHESIKLHFKKYYELKGRKFQCSMRIFTEIGMREIAFLIFIPSRPMPTNAPTG